MDYRASLEKRLTDEDKRLLKRIYAPQVVAVPPEDASTSLCVTDDGEIRIYGARDKKEPDDVGTLGYISSADAGLSWKFHLHESGALGAAEKNPATGRYIGYYPREFRGDLKNLSDREGTWALLNDEGFDSTDHRWVKLSDKRLHILKYPFYLESCGRWFILAEYWCPNHSDHIVTVFYSDDDGETWTEKVLPSVPPFAVREPHKGPRWENYSCEPTVTELSDGTLVMLVRTTQNYHYMYRSFDHGDTWTDPVPSIFHATNTMPVLHKLSDGRIVFFWCNTQPLPELDHEKTFPPLSDEEKRGVWEDVFTNRDADHLAISDDDMKTWTGFRELFLNEMRCRSDFRSLGGTDSRDKSVHQAQMLELPYNKLLVHLGQNRAVRKVVILDINWLYEKGRTENFRYGLENVSTQMYVRSNLGGYRGFSGHCAYNRTDGALLVPDPSGNFREVLQIGRVEDERLVYKKQGAVWNFPASAAGRVTVELSVRGSGVRLCLSDHWYNPCDETVADEASVAAEIVEKGDFTTVSIEYDTQKRTARLIGETEQRELSFGADAPYGLCYLHIQTLAEKQDTQGTLIRSLAQTAF